MSFFDELPPLPDRPRQPRNIPPVWTWPPADELPAVVPLGQFFHRSAHMVMAAKSVEVFSTGCLIEVVFSALRADESDSDWSRMTDLCFNRGPYRMDGGGGPNGSLQFGVALPDGRKTTTAQLDPEIFDGEEPTEPVLRSAGGGGGSASDSDLSTSSKFWLWPLPLGGDTRFVARWDDLGINEGSVALDGGQMQTAAANVQKYWPAPRDA